MGGRVVVYGYAVAALGGSIMIPSAFLRPAGFRPAFRSRMARSSVIRSLRVQSLRLARFRARKGNVPDECVFCFIVLVAFLLHLYVSGNLMAFL